MSNIAETLAQAKAYHRGRQLQRAEQLYRQVILMDSSHSETHYLLGTIYQSLGKIDDAIACFQESLRLNPDFHEAEQSLRQATARRAESRPRTRGPRTSGNSASSPEQLNRRGVELFQRGNHREAAEFFQLAVQKAPNYAEAHMNLGSASALLGNLDQATSCYRRAVQLKPDFADAYSNLGNALNTQGKLDEALVCFVRALELRPNLAEAHGNLGLVLLAQGRLDDAVARFRRAVQLKPDFVDAYSNLGNALSAQGKVDEAHACFRRALALKSDNAEAHCNLGVALVAEGKFDDAVVSLQRALELKPDYVEAHSNLGCALEGQGKLDDAVVCFRRALELRPNYAEGLRNLGSAFKTQGNLDEAVECFRRALELKPDYAEAHRNLAFAFKDQGKLNEAIACYRRAIEFRPSDVEAHSDLLFTLNYCPESDAKTLYEEHRRWNQQLCEPLAKFIQPHSNERSADRRLRIGYVSPDFREHAAAVFLLPLFRQHDHQQFEIVCYSQTSRRDTITDRFRGFADRWRDVAGMTDEALAQLIRDDRIDILVDLALHTAGNRLLVFARKPAPVQVSYLGYCGTTGLPAIDYRLTDPFLDPPGEDHGMYTESSFRLPETHWCYQPPIKTPAVNDLPASRVGYVTFACLNNFCKVSPLTLATWSQVLLATPESRLLLHSLRGSHRDRVREFFAERNIAPERISFVDRLPVVEYFQVYQQVDICLDPFPYGGGTTTCDALWMGAPVVSLKGRTAVGRAGFSILSNVGLAELVANEVDEYVRLAVALAADLSRLSTLRAKLRDRLQASPLMNAPRFARNIEAAYREMWTRWRQSPGALEQSISPDQMNQRGVEQFQQGNFSAAASFFQRAAESAPGFAEAHQNLGAASALLGNLDQATACFRRAVELKPNFPDAYSNLGNALNSQGKLDEAIVCFRRALELQPNHAEAHGNLGVALKNQGELDGAAACLGRAVQLNPDYCEGWRNLGAVCQSQGKLDEAAACFRQAIQIRPNYAEAHSNLGYSLKALGQLEEAIACYRRALEIKPDYAEAHSDLLFSLHYCPAYDAAAILEEHRRWNQRQCAPFASSIPTHSNERSSDRRLTIGYVSPDFCDHAVGLNLLPLFRKHDHERFKIICYSQVARGDTITDRFRGYADEWRDIRAMSDEALALRIREDHVDVLVDLALHTAGNRLLALARKPAPVQVAFAGYPGTTGLSTIDYRLTDPYLDPPGLTDHNYSEESVRLPHCFWCYDPLGDEPEVAVAPALHRGFVTFGCLNNPCKINAPTLKLWAQVLTAVDRSRIMILAAEGSARENMLSILNREGVSSDRVSFATSRPRCQYLELYHEFDIGLDTLPYNGHTTSLDSLWMGVPVITLVGRTSVGRAGCSQLMNLGMQELIAHQPEQFVLVARQLANDLTGLAELRASLRERMRRSTLTDSRRFAQSIEAAYREMWRRWVSAS